MINTSKYRLWKYVLMFLLLSPKIVFCQTPTQWQFLNPTPSNNPLLGVQTLNSTVAYAVGEGSTVLKLTTNGSNTTITPINIPQARSLLSVCFTNEQNGYVAGQRYSTVNNSNVTYYGIWKTSDGGATWSEEAIPGADLDWKGYFWRSVALTHVTINNQTVPVGVAVGDVGMIYRFQGNSGWQRITVSACSGSGAPKAYHQDYPYNEMPACSTTSFCNCTLTTIITSRLHEIKFSPTNHLVGYIVGDNNEDPSMINVKWEQASNDVNNDGKIDENDKIEVCESAVDCDDDNDNDPNDHVFRYKKRSPAVILKTTNGGANWTRIPVYTPTGGLVSVALHPTDVDRAIAISKVHAAGYNHSILVKTIDNGVEKWISQTSANTPVFSINKVGTTDLYPNGFWAVSFDGSGNIVTVGDRGIIARATASNYGSATTLSSITLETTNWSIDINTTNRDRHKLRAVSFAPGTSGIGYAVGYYGTLLKTTDGGVSWTNVGDARDNEKNNYLNSTHFINQNLAFAVGDRGTILKLTKSGNSWTTTLQKGPNRENYNAVHFLDENIGVAVGDHGTIAYTTNGGQQWCQQKNIQGTSNYSQFFKETNLYSVHIQSSGSSIFRGTIVGSNKAILRTTDGGNTWNIITPTWPAGVASAAMVTLYDVAFNSSGTIGIAVGNYLEASTSNGPGRNLPLVLKTTNMGVSWNNISTTCSTYLADNSYSNTELRSVCFKPNSQVVFIGGNALFCPVNQTTNLLRSQAYIANPINTADTIYNTNKWRAVGIAFQSLDYGDNWSAIQMIGNFIYSVGYSEGSGTTPVDAFYSIGDGGASAHNPPIWNNDQRTIVGSPIWRYPVSSSGALTGVRDFLNAGTHQPLRGISMVGGEAIAVGYMGTVLYNINASVSARKGFEDEESIKEIVDDIESIPYLKNIPNPFDNNTNINFRLNVAGQTKLKIFDAIGQEIATLVDEYRKAGEYNEVFDAGKLSAGVYFYQLQVNDITLTQKMTVIK